MAEWGYRLKDGEVEHKLFPAGRPEGWEDTPAKCVEAPKKRGRPRKREG